MRTFKRPEGRKTRVMYIVKHVLDAFSGVVLLLLILLAPWMIGATTRETIFALNVIGFLSGGLWILQRIFCALAKPVCNGEADHPTGRWPMAAVWVFVVVLLIYVLCSALNPKASLRYTFNPGYPFASGVEIEYLDNIDWLPHTYDQDRTMRAFWKYLSLALSFAAARDWLLGGCRKEQRSESSNLQFPGYRMQLLLWAFAVNAASVSLVGTLQRLDGTDKLLWTFSNHINGGHGAFGPFPYQSNGAQYLNLIWPLTIGLWWSLGRRNIGGWSARRLGGDPNVVLILLAILTAAGVVVAKSRGGFLVLIGLLGLVLALLMFRSKSQPGFKLAVIGAVVVVLWLGGWLGGGALIARFQTEDLSTMNGRKLIYEDTARMAEDFTVFGCGAETFAPLYYFYRKKDLAWNAYVHDDYLETRVTFGVVGFANILLIFFSICLVPFFGNGIPAPPEFILLIGVAMVGILVHAKFDLPFQVYSLHSQFVLLCAVLTTLKWQRG
jgi:O-antigen ligase